jgi:WhiB family redox-sensing transcriptional regulator
VIPVESDRPEWHQAAACRGVGTDVFFPERGESVVAAWAYCDRCPVRAECAAAGLTEHHGIWGGRSEPRRRRLRRAAGITAPPPDECPHGHPFNEANTRITPEGYRRCRECHRLAALEYKERTR